MIGGEAQNRSVLITGAAGFGGSHLVRELLDLDWLVTGLDVVAPNHAETLRAEFAHPGFRYLWKSIQDIQPADIAGHAVVAHLNQSQGETRRSMG